MEISIDDKIKRLTPDFQIGVLICDVEVHNNNELDSIIHNLENEINDSIDIKDVINLKIIKDGRDSYKKYGKDPSRYRLAVESLYRRLSKGNKLYRINNVVDLGNILSVKTRKSVAVLDYNKIKGDVLIRLGTLEDAYYGIGRGKLNVSNIPVYEDSIGPFGSVTSDTERTMITNNTSKILLFIISFSKKGSLQNELEYAKDLYQKYANGKNFSWNIL